VITRVHQWLHDQCSLAIWARKPKCESFGVWLVDASGGPRDGSRFLRAVHDALDLIRRRDPHRFRRVRRFVLWIVNQPSLTVAHYRAGIKAVVLDFGQAQEMFGDTGLIVGLGATLIHEATHGLLKARGVNRRRCIRVERLCWREESRFLGRFDRELMRRHEEAFVPEWWRLHWRRSYSERFRFLMKRVTETQQGSNHSVEATADPPRRRA
jgi:hypothetical protein